MPPELYASTGHASAKKRNKIPRAANLGEDADAHRSFGDGDAMRVSVTWEKVDARAHLPVGADPLDSDTFVPADARADRPLDDDAAENAPRAPATVPDAFDDDAFAFAPGDPDHHPEPEHHPGDPEHHPGDPEHHSGDPEHHPGDPDHHPAPELHPGDHPARASSPHDLDDVPVNGAPHKSFDQMLEERLAAEDASPAPSASRADAQPRPNAVRTFLKKGARSQRTVPPRRTVKPAVASASSAPSARVDTNLRARDRRETSRESASGSSRREPASRTAATRARGGSYAASYLESASAGDRFGYDDAETTAEASAGGKKAATSTSRPRARQTGREEEEAMELAEFEALERELAVGVGAGKANVDAPRSASKGRATAEREKVAAAMRAARAADDDDDDFAVEDHFGGESLRESLRDGSLRGSLRDGSLRDGSLRDGLRAASRGRAAGAPPPAFDDDEEWGTDEEEETRAASTKEASARASAPASPGKPGDGAPALIKSLFYGANGGTSAAGARRSSAAAPRSPSRRESTASEGEGESGGGRRRRRGSRRRREGCRRRRASRA